MTTILVTHDQDEAFELADRIGVLDRGRLLEVGRPEALYAAPRTLFAATFLGAGTVLVGRAHRDSARFGPLVLPIPPDVPHEDGAPVQLLFRPEQVCLSIEPPAGKGTVVGRGIIVEQNFIGASHRLRLRLPRLPATRQVAPAVSFGEEGLIVDAVIPADDPPTSQELWVSLRGWHILQQPEPHLLVYDEEGEPSTLMLARQLIERTNARATLLAVTTDIDSIESVRAASRQRQRSVGLSQVQLRVRVGEPAEQIAMEQMETFYWMVIVAPRAATFGDSTHDEAERQRPRRPGRLGPTVVRLLEQSNAPMLLAKQARETLARVLICTAVGEPGKNDVRVGGRLARRLGAAVTLLYVTKEANEPGRLAHAHLDRAAATLRALDVPVEVRIRRAVTPARGILAESLDGNHDLIVVGSHGPQSRSVFGRDDVTLQVLTGADRPVLVIPSDDLS